MRVVPMCFVSSAAALASAVALLAPGGAPEGAIPSRALTEFASVGEAALPPLRAPGPPHRLAVPTGPVPDASPAGVCSAPPTNPNPPDQPDVAQLRSELDLA